MEPVYLMSCIIVLAILNICLRSASFILPLRVIRHPLTRELSRYLPAMVMSLLVIMCIRDIATDPRHLTAGLTGLLVLTVIHLLRRNALLSIVSGTVVYMLMIN